MKASGTTASGFKYEISDSVKNDYELVEALSELEENPLLLTKIVTKVLGKEQSKNLKDHLRNEDGVVPTDLMLTEIIEIFKGNEDTKNSSSSADI